MDELALVESQDATMRYIEGGGAIPRYMHTPTDMQGLGQAGSQGVWYKNKTWLVLMGLGVAATGLVAYAAMKKEK